MPRRRRSPRAEFIRLYGKAPRHWMPAGACPRGSGGGHDNQKVIPAQAGIQKAVWTIANRSKSRRGRRDRRARRRFQRRLAVRQRRRKEKVPKQELSGYDVRGGEIANHEPSEESRALSHLNRLTCPVTGARRPTHAHGGASARVRVDRGVRCHMSVTSCSAP